MAFSIPIPPIIGGPLLTHRPNPPHVSGGYGFAQLRDLWIRAGGPPAVADIAAAIALAESHGNPNAKNGPYHGLWQVGPGGPMDPLQNARAAVAKYRAAGNKFTPWTTYTGADTPGHRKTYKDFLPKIGTPFSGVPGVTSAEGAITDTGKAAVDTATAIPNFIKRVEGTIFDADWWLRVGMILLGVLAFAAAIFFLGRELIGGQVANIAKTALKKR